MPAAEVGRADLAYCVTGECAQGRTVSYGLAVFRGGESRGWTGRGHASLLQLWLRWGRLASYRESRRTRPSLTPGSG
jgi:hypothetical protein